jgi:hypothetical protein
MKRRDFMKRAIGSGVLIASSTLPAWGEDKPEVFPKRGESERLSLSYATVHIGLEKPFSALHISDTHLTAAYDNEGEKKKELRTKRTVTFGGRQEEALRDTLNWARKRTDYVLHTGDIIDWQSQANYDLVKKYFGEDNIKKLIGAPGNHEYSPDMWLSEVKEEPTEEYRNLSRKALSEVYPFDITFNAQVVNGVNFIALDDVYGTVTAKQVELFKKEVERGLPIVLCMHVPFITEDIWRATCRYWNSSKDGMFCNKEFAPSGDYKRQLDDSVTRDFISYLKKEPLLKAILSGHEHITVEDVFSETAKQYLVAGNFTFHAREVLFI